jgi:succinyl-diaminopimelate desuccinylase
MTSLSDTLPLIAHESGLDAICLAQQLIRIETCQSDHGVRQALELLGNFARDAGASFELVESSGTPAGLVARWGDQPSLALCGHVDTVPADPAAWNRSPLSGAVERGRLHGRGACDMKGALAAMAVALRDAAGMRPLDDVALVVTAAEEVDSAGATALLQAGALDGISAMVIGEPTRMDLGIGHKGALWVTLETTGVPAHSSQPEQGRNAVLEMLSWLTPFDELEQRLIGDTADAALGRPTVSLNMVNGGVARNVVPARCRAEIDIRTVPGMLHPDLLAILEERAAGGTVEVARDAVSVVAAQDHPFVERVRRCLARSLATEPHLRALPYVTDASALGSLDAVTVFFGPGDERLAHTENEHVDVRDVYLAVRCYTDLLLDEAGPS